MLKIICPVLTWFPYKRSFSFIGSPNKMAALGIAKIKVFCCTINLFCYYIRDMPKTFIEGIKNFNKINKIDSNGNCRYFVVY